METLNQPILSRRRFIECSTLVLSSKLIILFCGLVLLANLVSPTSDRQVSVDQWSSLKQLCYYYKRLQLTEETS